jgi:hypothetical protein
MEEGRQDESRVCYPSWTYLPWGPPA